MARSSRCRAQQQTAVAPVTVGQLALPATTPSKLLRHHHRPALNTGSM
ncbi:hypothetical protein I552_2318 [Mycobacterium xenopi 3993]|nr:hypothetical protein I552_2318 [Mycobacterium xenopi 3993]